MPIDDRVGRALGSRRAVTVQPLDAKAAKNAEGKHVGLKPVTPFTACWVRVCGTGCASIRPAMPPPRMSPPLCSRSATATSIVGGVSIGAAPPYFDVPKRLARTSPKFKPFLPAHIDTHAFPSKPLDSPTRRGHPMPRPFTNGHAGTAATRRLGPARPVLERLRDCHEQLSFTRNELAK